MSANLWAVVVPAARYAAERLYAFDTLALRRTAVGRAVADGRPAESGTPRPGDRAALIAATAPPVLFGLGVVVADGAGATTHELVISYTHRLFDDPPPVEAVTVELGPHDGEPAETGPDETGPDGVSPIEARVHLLPEAAFGRLRRLAGIDARGRSEAQWLVSVALPIEAASRAEAVREFWTYVRSLGPRELPAYVWPRGDELAMQAFVLGEETNLDPEQ